MTNVGEVLVGSVSAEQDLLQIEALAESRGFTDSGMIESNDVWVFGVREEEKGPIIGAAAVQLDPFNSSQADLLFDFVDEEHRGKGIGRILVKNTVKTIQDLIGRDIVVDSAMVEKNPDDFEGLKVKERKLGAGVLLSV